MSSAPKTADVLDLVAVARIVSTHEWREL